MDKNKMAKYFLDRAENAKDEASKLLCLYDGLFFLYGKETFQEAEKWGFNAKTLADAVEFARGDSESFKAVRLTAKEFEKLKAMLQEAIN